MKGKKAIDKKELNIIKGVEVIKSSPEEVKSRNIQYNKALNLHIKLNAVIVFVADISDTNNNISVNDK